MRILVACEESQTICIAFRNKGHEAYSCDTQPCSGGHPEWHFQCDVRKVINDSWDLVIAHPTCTRLANSGVLRLYKNGKKENGIDLVKWQEMLDGVDFFKLFLNTNCPRVCIENPIQHSHAAKLIGCKYSQIIQPYNFGENAKKATCIWLKGLPLLVGTSYYPPQVINGREIWGNQTASGQNKLPPDRKGHEGERAKQRSKTYRGLAEAMADQWNF